MSSFKFLGAALVVATLVAAPVSAQEAVSEPGAAAFYHPNADILHANTPAPSGAFAAMRETNARRNNDQPEKQFSEFDEARKIYHEILNFDPNCVEAYRGLGRVYIGLGDFERAAAPRAAAGRDCDLCPRNAPS